jgi:hypothetical protein
MRISLQLRVLGVLAVLLAFPVFLIFAAVRRSTRQPTAPAEYVLLPPCPRRDGR